MIEVKPSNTGSVRFVNCAFWGPCNQIAKVAGKGTAGFSDCTFVRWDRKNEDRHALQVSGGSVIVRGCEFQARKPQIELGDQVRRAVVTGNLLSGKPRISNRSKGSVEIANNPAE